MRGNISLSFHCSTGIISLNSPQPFQSLWILPLYVKWILKPSLNNSEYLLLTSLLTVRFQQGSLKIALEWDQQSAGRRRGKIRHPVTTLYSVSCDSGSIKTSKLKDEASVSGAGCGRVQVRTYWTLTHTQWPEVVCSVFEMSVRWRC